MTQPLAVAVQGRVGQPATIRIGTITSVGPVVLTIQGANYQGSAVGTLGSYTPSLGDVVAVVGQSPSSGSDPTSWLILGDITPVS